MQKNHISLYLPSFGYCNACPSEVVPVSANCSRIFYPQASVRRPLRGSQLVERNRRGFLTKIAALGGFIKFVKR